MDNKDIQKLNADVQNIHDKMLHAFKLHLKVAEERRSIIEAIDKLNFVGSKDPKAGKAKMNGLFEELAKCHNDERRIIAITAPAISETKIGLNTLTKGNEKNLGEDEQEILASMFNVLDYIEKNIYLTRNRIDAEEKYLKSQDDTTSGNYSESVRKEYAMEEKVLTLLNPAYIQSLEKLGKSSGYKKAAVAGGAVSLITGGPIFILIAAMMMQYKLETEKIMKQQKDMLLKFQHR